MSETIEDLRIILHKFEHSPEADYDEFALVELKRIIFDRIAELETERAMNEKAMTQLSYRLSKHHRAGSAP